MAGTRHSESGRTQSGRFTELDADKLRGGYYTRSDVAAWLCAWAIRTPRDRVLEPSCGDGAFLVASAERFAELNVPQSDIASRLTGVEIIADEADRAEKRLSRQVGLPVRGVVRRDDFFAWWQRHERTCFDAVIGNPPFIRYQSFPEPCRSRAMEIMAELGLTPNRLTNVWVPFVVAATASLRPGGRLAFVLPAGLLQVTYASQLRSFLTDHFKRINLVTCNELFFEKAEQEIVLLLAEEALASASGTNRCRVTMNQARTVRDIVDRLPSEVLSDAEPKTVQHDCEKWLKYFLTRREIAFMRELRSGETATALGTHASVDVGVVTGKNAFFVLDAEQVAEFGLGEYTVPLVSRSAHLKGASIRGKELQELAAEGNRVSLLHLAPLDSSELAEPLARYIRIGEDNAVHKGYKCSIRDPWYCVPSVWVPDGFALRQIYDFPRVILNAARATSTDTIHRLTCKNDPELFVRNTYTYLTGASAEIEGRSYGGGVLELEPTEAERLLVPAELRGGLPLEECDRLVRAGRLDNVLAENARLILMDVVGLSRAECSSLRAIWTRMRDRRLARRRRKQLSRRPGAAQ